MISDFLRLEGVVSYVEWEEKAFSAESFPSKSDVE